MEFGGGTETRQHRPVALMFGEAILSGSQQGAGGVGGLLEVSYHGASTTNCFVAYDGNGNVAALINTADGTCAPNTNMAPSGKPMRATRPMAKLNPFRFSTKYQDDESDLLYSGYRPYKPQQEPGQIGIQRLTMRSPRSIPIFMEPTKLLCRG